MNNEHNTNVPEKKRVEKVVTGSAKTKTNEVRKITDVFIAKDVKDVTSHIMMDVLVPAIKKAIVDIVTDGVNMIFWGGTAGPSKGGSKVSYSSYYDDRNNRPKAETVGGSRFDYEDIIFRSRGDAEAVLNSMHDALARYGAVTVGDMYDMSDLTPPYTSNRYGWTSIRTAYVDRVRDGYVIKLPKAGPLD